MSRFKVGQTVRCINDDGSGDGPNTVGLGHVYTISSVESGFVGIAEKYDNIYSPSRFEPVASSPLNPEEWHAGRAEDVANSSDHWTEQVIAVWVLCELAREGRLILAPTKPRQPTVMVEMRRHDAELYADADRATVTYSRRHRLADACRAALESDR